MSGINFIGSYSGIDQSTINKLMEIEKLPLQQLSDKKSNIKVQQDAWRDINTRLNSLFEKLNVLSKEDTFLTKTAKSTNKDFVNMVPSKNATSGTYNINVKQLANSSSLIGGRIVDADGKTTEALGVEGNLIIKNQEGAAIEIDISGEDSLRNIVNKINNGKYFPVGEEKGISIEITANIIDGRIVLTDKKTGARNIELSGDTVDELKLNEGLNIGKGSIFTINGVYVERDSNTIDDVVEDVAIYFSKVHEEGQYDTITIDIDIDKASKAVKDFVDQYNSTLKFIDESVEPGLPEEIGSRGPLASDTSLMRLQSYLRTIITSAINNPETSLKDISQIGVSTEDKSGQLKFNEAKFKENLEKNTGEVMNFFHTKIDEENEMGIVKNLGSYIDGFISKSNGLIKVKTESYDRTIGDINRQIDTLNERIERKEQYYIKMFSALDVAIMQAESQMQWLQGQIDAMNGIKG